MSTGKEKVLAYFEEWNNKGTNPANGCNVFWTRPQNREDPHAVTGWQIYLDSEQVYQISTHTALYPAHDRDFEAAARILKLDKPKAAEIQWRQVDKFVEAGEGYSVEQRGSAGWVAYFQSSRFEDRYYPSEEAAKQACQDHKQKRLEELL